MMITHRPALIKSILTISVILSLSILAFIVYRATSVYDKVSDFCEYYAPAKFIQEGKGADSYVISQMAQEQHNLFPGMDKNRVVLLFVPPQGLVLISPIGKLSLPTACIVWKIMLIFCLLVSIIFLVLCFDLNYTQTCLLASGLCLSQACIEAIRIDQLAPILLLGLSAAIYFLCKKNGWLAGLFLSLVFLKPQQLLPFLVYLVGLRYWRPIMVLVLIAAALTFTAYWQIGVPGFHNYFALLKTDDIAAYMQPELTTTLRGQLLRFFPNHAHIIFEISSFVCMLVFCLAYFLGNKMQGKDNALLVGILAIIPIGLISSIHCHSYDLLLLVPSLITLFKDTLLFSNRFKFFVVLGIFTFMFPIATNLHYNYLLKGGVINIWFIELLILSAAIVFKLSQKIGTRTIPR